MDFQFSPNPGKGNPNASSTNILQVKVPTVRPTVHLDPDVDPATVDINFTKAVNGGGGFDYQIVPGAAGDNQPKRVFWFDTLTGSGAADCPQIVDHVGADLDDRSGIDALVNLTLATVYALVVTEDGNLTMVTLT